MKKKYIVVIIICLIFSIIKGILTDDLIIGGTIVTTGLLNAYFASEGKRINYILGLINYLLMSYVAFKNNLYGMSIFYIGIFAPLQIKGFLTWHKNLDENKNVQVKEFTLKNSIIIMISCVIASLILGYLLTCIPNQRLVFLDASSNCINLCGIILMILRFKESWWLWLINNFLDLLIWICTVINKGSYFMMALFVSIGYFLINIQGLIKWSRKAKKENKKIFL